MIDAMDIDSDLRLRRRAHIETLRSSAMSLHGVFQRSGLRTEAVGRRHS
jgi:hypothetical protein